jgi:hypothetical protein
MEAAMPSEKNPTSKTDVPSAESTQASTKVIKGAKTHTKGATVSPPGKQKRLTRTVAAKQEQAEPAAVDQEVQKEEPVVTKPAVKAKVAAKGAPKAAAKAKSAEAAVKAKKDKLVRDSFTMPESEYALISQLKKRCLVKGIAAKKSEILRAAIVSFAAASDANVLKAVKQLNFIKTGRPSKDKA